MSVRILDAPDTFQVRAQNGDDPKRHPNPGQINSDSQES